MYSEVKRKKFNVNEILVIYEMIDNSFMLISQLWML